MKKIIYLSIILSITFLKLSFAEEALQVKAICSIDDSKDTSLYSDYMFYTDKYGYHFLQSSEFANKKYPESEMSIARLKRNESMFSFFWSPVSFQYDSDPSTKALHKVLLAVLKANNIKFNVLDEYYVAQIYSPQNSAQMDEDEHPVLFLLTGAFENKKKLGALIDFKDDYNSLDPEAIYPCLKLSL